MKNVVLAGTACAVALLASAACTGDPLDMPDYTAAGQKVTVSVPLRFPEMDIRTRAAHTEEDENRVETLWVRTYSALTGKATSHWVKPELEQPTTDTETGREVEVEIETLSGATYIVGVANVANPGIRKDAPDDVKPLSELLSAADTWAEFLDIAVVSPSVFGDVYAAPVPLAMSGCYSGIKPGDPHPNIADWQNSNFTSYFIPGQKDPVKLDGAIHLRRLVSHVTFEIVPGEDVDVTVNSYTVYNAPKFSHLYERSGTGGRKANFGDYALTEDAADAYFAEPLEYSAQYVSRDADGSSSFDFWQGENKHTVSGVGSYHERDVMDAGGLFTSLTGDAWTPANMASYVRIKCSVEYKEQVTVDGDGNASTSGSPMHREGDTDYLVHLGYIGGNNGDFNCYRNTRYKYTLHVNGLDDIRLDAYAGQERFHGEEGVVSDLEHATIELDAHYHAFNIELTEDELKAANFGYIITSYFGGKRYDVDENTDLSAVDEKFYNWIELRPASGQYGLAAYRPRTGSFSTPESSPDGKVTFLLAALKKGDKSSVWDNMTEQMRSGSGWYTVFVNENTYEKVYKYGDSGYGNEKTAPGSRPDWAGYVNQDPRRFFIRVTRKVSPDGKSVYSRSKYGISQRSIQTYYSLAGITSEGTAVGLERCNETEGLNMRNSFSNESTSVSNGRYNVALYLGNLTSKVDDADSRPLWSDHVDQTSPLEIPAVTGQRAQGWYDLPDRTAGSEAGPLPLPKLSAYTGQRQPAFNDPQDSDEEDYYIEAINACMNRNRDNNGNGRIDPEELRWYVPALGKYLRLILGSASLADPLMDYENGPENLPKVNASNDGWGGSVVKNDCLTRYMFVSSDTRDAWSDGNYVPVVLWVLEGMSTSNWNQVVGWGKGYPWQVRCIRNLGTDLRGEITEADKTTAAYIVSEDSRIVELKYYDARSVRPTRLSGNGNGPGQMPAHDVTSSYNQGYGKFEYDDTDLDIPGEYWTLSRLKEYVETDPCRVRGDNWRIPNQKELAILKNIGVLSGHHLWLSCTYNYYNGTTGAAGGGFLNGQNTFLGMLEDRGTQTTPGNIRDFTGRIRCVRDVR